MKIKILLSLILAFCIGLFASSKDNTATGKEKGICTGVKVISPVAKLPAVEITADQELTELSPMGYLFTAQI